MNINAWIDELSKVTLPNVFNPWKESCDMDIEKHPAKEKRHRLKLHLSTDNPRFIGIGEAPGYQGCRYSGCAFTSERLLFEGAIPGIEGQAGKRITSRPSPFSEPSATITWSTLYKLHLEDQMLLWNAFPFHPMKDKPLSNRTPTRQELEYGIPYLEAMLDLFQGIQVLAIGQKASDSLSRLGIKPAAKLRHPSMGGATKFKNGLEEFVSGS